MFQVFTACGPHIITSFSIRLTIFVDMLVCLYGCKKDPKRQQSRKSIKLTDLQGINAGGPAKTSVKRHSQQIRSSQAIVLEEVVDDEGEGHQYLCHYTLGAAPFVLNIMVASNADGTRKTYGEPAGKYMDRDQ